MIVLTSNEKLQIELGAAVTAADLHCFASFRDITTTTYSADNDYDTCGGSPIDLVSAPASGTSRVIDHISIQQTDTVSATVYVHIYDIGNTATYTPWTFVLAPGDNLVYEDGVGWKVL
jgi:hypothetical protein